LTSLPNEPYLKYAFFCRGTDEGSEGELILHDVVDLIDLPELPESAETAPVVRKHEELHLVYCIVDATPGPHSLIVAINAPGIRLELPPSPDIEVGDGIKFYRGIKPFSIPIQEEGWHVARILLDGTPLGEGSFLVRLQDKST